MAVQSLIKVAELIVSIPESSRWKVDREIDFENKDVQGRTIPQHLGRIAAQMIDWKGTISDNLGLAIVDRADIMEKYSQKPELQRYDYTRTDINFISSQIINANYY